MSSPWVSRRLDVVCLEVLRPEATCSRASSALQVRDCWSSAFVEERRERESVHVCKNVNVQEAQSEEFLFTAAVYRK